MSNKLRKKRELREFVIGIDETNNGLGLKSSNPNYENSVIVTGYMMIDPHRANYGSAKYEGKGWAFGPKRNNIRSVERGTQYMDQHPDFFYTLITKNSMKNTPLGILKAEAITAITLKFLLSYNFLKTRNVHVVTDEMDGKEHSEDIQVALNLYFSQSGINNISRTYKREADKKVVAVKRADIIGYSLAGIHLFSESKKWPRRSRKIPINSLDRLMETYYKENDGKYDLE